jgi:hypothetical protein
MRLSTLSLTLSCRVPVLPLARRRDPAQDCSTAIRSVARSGELHTHGERLRQILGRRYRINYCKNRSFFCGPLTLGSSTSTLVRRFDAGLKRITETARSRFQFLRRWTRTKKQGFSQHPERRGRGFSDIPRMSPSGVPNEAIQRCFFVGDFRDGSLCDTIHGSDTPLNRFRIGQPVTK